MKILVLATHPLQDNRISKMLKTVRMAGHDVTYINISTQQQIAPGWLQGIKVVKYCFELRKKSIFKAVPLFVRLSRYIMREKPDIVHVHDPYLIPLLIVAKHRGGMTVFDKHEAYETISGFAGESAAWCEKHFNRYIDGIVYVTKAQEEYISRFSYGSQKLIPNYQSEEEFSKAAVEPHAGIRLFYAGDLSDVSRNTLVMLELVEAALRRYPYVSCTIAGGTREIAVKQKIDEMAEHLSNFHYVDYMLYSDVIYYTKNADIGLYLTKYDRNNVGSSPNKINEYLMAGIAIFTQGRFAEWELIDGKAGVVYDYSVNFDDMYVGLCKLIEDSRAIEKMKLASRALGKARTWESVEKRYLELYAELMMQRIETEEK